ncbi:MAG: coenzyme F420-0:L-glutamate ligase [Emcibacter sp.]|nr:coenzyme F420-0:L-glutamate ligase [Emcibacter sp.]
MSLSIKAVQGIPKIKQGDDLVALIIAAMNRSSLHIEDGNILVLAQKIVSKAEGRLVHLDTVKVGEEALSLAAKTNKDPRLVQLILNESEEVVRYREGAIIVAHKIGLVHANAGIDRSNIEESESALLLPEDPDASAAKIREGLEQHYGVHIGVIISDSMGRAWRNGTVGFAIGSSGVETLKNLVGQPDMFGRLLEITTVGHGDELAAAASIVMGQADEAIPVALIQGLHAVKTNQTATALLRKKSEDMFR